MRLQEGGKQDWIKKRQREKRMDNGDGCEEGRKKEKKAMKAGMGRG